jgi:hypothetical protein
MQSVYTRYFKTVALTWAGCLVLFCLAYMVLLAPQRKEKKRVAEEFAEKKQTLEAIEELTHEETRIRLNKQVQQLRDKLDDFLIDSERSADLTFDISRIASDKEVSSFRIKSKDKRGGAELPDRRHISETQIAVAFTARFNQFAAFINTLERHRPVVFVDRFKITRSKQENSANKVSADLTVLVRTKEQS